MKWSSWTLQRSGLCSSVGMKVLPPQLGLLCRHPCGGVWCLLQPGGVEVLVLHSVPSLLGWVGLQFFYVVPGWSYCLKVFCPLGSLAREQAFLGTFLSESVGISNTWSGACEATDNPQCCSLIPTVLSDLLSFLHF